MSVQCQYHFSFLNSSQYKFVFGSRFSLGQFLSMVFYILASNSSCHASFQLSFFSTHSCSYIYFNDTCYPPSLEFCRSIPHYLGITCMSILERGGSEKEEQVRFASRKYENPTNFSRLHAQGQGQMKIGARRSCVD